jgi:hypothetical protein
MNPDVYEKWVGALRSGEYPQAIGRLHYNGKFCCLGVLCKLHSQETGQVWVGDTYLGEKHYLPQAVVEWAGLDNNDPSVETKYHEEKALSLLNDKGYSFDDIAQWIEEQL